MKYLNILFSSALSIFRDLFHLHPFAKNIIHGSIQFSIVLYGFSALLYYFGPYTVNYIQCIEYYQAALKIAPVIIAGGIVSALLIDLVMRKSKQSSDGGDSSNNNENKK